MMFHSNLYCALTFYTNIMYPINYTIVDIKRFISTYKTIKKK